MSVAGLFNTLKTKQGSLATTSTEELAKQTGLPAQPITPVGSSTLGANPHQAKMAGASAQKTSALRQSIQGNQELDTAQRQKQARTLATAEEKSTVDKAKGLQGLGDLQTRVNEIANKKLTTGAQAAASTPAALTTATSTIAGMPELVSKLKSNPQDQATLASIAQLIHPGQALTPDEVSHLVTTDIGGGVAKAVDNTVKASELPGDMVNNINKALPGVDLSNMTIEQLQDAIQQEIDAEMSSVSSLDQQMASPYVGEAQRQSALESARDLSSVGVASAENQAQNVNKQIQQGDTINFMGKEVPLSTFLSDDNVAKMVKDFLADPTSESNKQLAQQNPDFTKFVNQYKDVLDKAVADLSSGVAEQQKTVEANKAIASVDVGGGQKVTLNDAVMKSIFPDWGSVTGKAFNPALSPILTTLSNNALPAGDKQFFISLLNDHPEFASDISKMSPDELSTLISNPEVKQKADDINKVKSLNEALPDHTATALGFGNMSEMQNSISTGLAQARADGTTKQFMDKLHAAGIRLDAKGNVDVHSTNEWLKKKTPGDVHNIFDPKVKSLKSDVGGVTDIMKSASPFAQSVAKNVKGALDTPGEWESISSDALSDPGKFFNSQTYREAPKETKALIDKSVISNINTDNDQFIEKNIPGVGGLRGLLYTLQHPGNATEIGPEASKTQNVIRTLQNDMKNAPTPAAKAHLQSTINTIQGALKENIDYINNAPKRAAAVKEEARVKAVEEARAYAKEHANDPGELQKLVQKGLLPEDEMLKIVGKVNPTLADKLRNVVHAPESVAKVVDKFSKLGLKTATSDKGGRGKLF
jgi:hypothetical protein